MPDKWPKLSVWVTAGRRNYIRQCLPSFLDKCKYPNFETLIAYYLPDDPNGIREYLENVEAPGKRLFDATALSLPDTYRMLLDESADLFLNIGDDFEYLADPTPMIQDAVVLMMNEPEVGCVRITAHTPLFIDLLVPKEMELWNSVVGPTVAGFSASDSQHVSKTEAFRAAMPFGLWDTPSGFRSIQVRNPLQRSGYFGTTMLRHWGASLHIGDVGEDHWRVVENQLNARESAVIRRKGMLGPRPANTLYFNWCDEEAKREFVYPLFLGGIEPMVSNWIPAAAQARLGKPGGVLQDTGFDEVKVDHVSAERPDDAVCGTP